MAANTKGDEPIQRECANCGGIEGLLRCSRCRQAWFCSLKCQKAIWPFHKSECVKNEFADAIEEKEPAFAAWMRRHGKQAVLKDDEIDRLERAGKASSGLSRDEVMESMYGRLLPKPKEASYTAEEKLRMRATEEKEKLAARMMSERDRAWASVEIHPLLGMDCGSYKWQQNQSRVEIFCRIPEKCTLREVQVALQPTAISVAVNSCAILRGRLFARIRQEDSTWYAEGGVLFITLLKSNRRGCYQNGSTNADTFWRAVLEREPEGESLMVQHPPSTYYSSSWEDPEEGRSSLNGKKTRKQAARLKSN